MLLLVCLIEISTLDTIKHPCTSAGDETCSGGYCSQCIYRYLFKVQTASHATSQEGEARKPLARALSNYSVPSRTCLTRKRSDSL